MSAPGKMQPLRDDVDPEGLLEYSVVYTDRALNHMSHTFQGVMKDISSTLKEAYSASATAVVPGGGTFAMEAVARQFALGERCMVLRHGWFSYRWTQILEMANLPSDTKVLMAEKVNRKTNTEKSAPFAPPPVADVCAAIREYKPAVFFAPHVETSAGIILPDDYLREIGKAVSEVGGLFVLDCIASGAIWVDMKDTGVDVLISAPQKGWSGPSCAGFVMFGGRGVERLQETRSNSFAADLRKWHEIMAAYENGAHAYHATMPTDALRLASVQMLETRKLGFNETRSRQQELGDKVRAMLARHGLKSVADSGFEAPGVVVVYTDHPAIQNGSLFVEQGVQVAAGVPLMIEEGPDFSTVRMGLFGLDKLNDVSGTVERLEKAWLSVLENSALENSALESSDAGSESGSNNTAVPA